MPLLEVSGISKKFNLKSSSYEDDIFYALRDITFSLEAGECLGIIGANGSGKSTLLKIISGIIKPNTGTVKHYSTFSSILELGFGMLPDFTGRENIFLLGELENYSRSEMKELMDEIIEFADINEFIDQPVKTYSNGMYLRLAFGIRAFLRSDLMILDEIISVGDAGFREKSLFTLKEMIKNGKACIIASHSPQELLEFSSRIIWLEEGKIKSDGLPVEIMNDYLLLQYESQEKKSKHSKSLLPAEMADKDTPVLLNKIEVKAKNKKITEPIRVDDDIEITIEYTKQSNSPKCEVAINLFTLTGIHLFVDCLTSRNQHFDYKMIDGKYTATCVIPRFLLNRGTYFLDLIFIQGGLGDTFEIKKATLFKIEFMPNAENDEQGNQVLQLMKQNESILNVHPDWTLKNEKGEVVFSY